MAWLKRCRLRPSIEGLEDRRMLSGSTANVIGTSVGTVTRPGEVSKTSAIVAPGNLTPHRRSTTFAVFVKASDGSGLQPRIAAATNAQGKPLPLVRGRVAGIGRNQTTVGFTNTNQAGALTTGVTGGGGTTGSYGAVTTLVGDLNGDGKVDFTDLEQFAKSVNTKIGDPNYNPAADFNHNGVINLYDVKAFMRNMQPLTRYMPLNINIHIVHGQQPRWNATTTSGASTVFQTPVFVGRTTPGTLIIEDNSGAGQLPGANQTYKFSGPAHYAGPNGYFQFTTSYPNTAGLNNNDFLFVDPFGHEVIRAVPVFWIPYAAGKIGSRNG